MASIVIELTNKCNFKCIFCEATKMRTHASLDYNIALELLDIAKNENIHGNFINKCIVGGNGEATLYDKLADFICEAKKRFKAVEMITNGYLLTMEKSIALLNSQIDYIGISMTGITPEVYSKFQGSGIPYEKSSSNFEIVKNNVINLINLRDNSSSQYKTKIYVRFIKCEESKNELKEYIKYWKKQGADGVFITNLYNFHKEKGKIKRCVFSPRSLLVYADGRVRPCNCGYDDSNVGNIHKESLNYIIKSNVYISEVKRRMERDINIIPKTCQTCEHRRSLILGEAIRNMRQKIFLKKPLKNIIYKFYGPSLIIFDYITRLKFVYNLFLFILKTESRITRMKFDSKTNKKKVF